MRIFIEVYALLISHYVPKIKPKKENKTIMQIREKLVNRERVFHLQFHIGVMCMSYEQWNIYKLFY